VLHGGDDLGMEGAICWENVPDKPNTPMNCELDWSNVHTVGADAWLRRGWDWFSFPILSQEIGWEERLQSDLFCVRWDVKVKP